MDCAEKKGNTGNRKLIAFLVSFVIMAEATLVAADGLGSNGLWVPFQETFGVHGWNDCWLDFMDVLSEGIMMPFGALCMCLFIGYEYGIKRFGEEITVAGLPFRTEAFFTVCCKYIAPVGLAFVLWGQLKAFGLV